MGVEEGLLIEENFMRKFFIEKKFGDPNLHKTATTIDDAREDSKDFLKQDQEKDMEKYSERFDLKKIQEEAERVNSILDRFESLQATATGSTPSEDGKYDDGWNTVFLEGVVDGKKIEIEALFNKGTMVRGKFNGIDVSHDYEDSDNDGVRKLDETVGPVIRLCLDKYLEHAQYANFAKGELHGLKATAQTFKRLNTAAIESIGEIFTESDITEQEIKEMYQMDFPSLLDARDYFDSDEIESGDLEFSRPGNPHEGESEVDYLRLVYTPKTEKIIKRALLKRKKEDTMKEGRNDIEGEE